ncbi:hypothetical protein PGT21_016986 [Puccinia graminis f. sp. tritici]|uniref:Uncharacterized protein n=1 Tax=Puccinia graminis f. sp. tritici TaxID=56615 RepID=A0A5B0MFT4_PUCGR|nr:hypothetical protein PGT21_016986 [Puccinia graminis f. sp. tritici]
MVINDDSSSNSRPESIPFGPTTEWGNTQLAAPPVNAANPNPSARDMMEFDYNTIQNRLVGANPYPFCTQVYRKEDLLFLFQNVANNFIHLSNKYPASTLGEIDIAEILEEVESNFLSSLEFNDWFGQRF